MSRPSSNTAHRRASATASPVELSRSYALAVSASAGSDVAVDVGERAPHVGEHLDDGHATIVTQELVEAAARRDGG